MLAGVESFFLLGSVDCSAFRNTTTTNLFRVHIKLFFNYKIMWIIYGTIIENQWAGLMSNFLIPEASRGNRQLKLKNCNFLLGIDSDSVSLIHYHHIYQSITSFFTSNFIIYGVSTFCYIQMLISNIYCKAKKNSQNIDK